MFTIVFTYVYHSLLEFTNVYHHLLVLVYLSLPNVYSCTFVYLCLPMFTRIYLLLVLNYVYNYFIVLIYV